MAYLLFILIPVIIIKIIVTCLERPIDFNPLQETPKFKERHNALLEWYNSRKRRKQELLQQKYPDFKIKNEPHPNCTNCHGVGEYLNKHGNLVLCICTCIEESNSLRTDIGSIFLDAVKEVLKTW